MLEKLVIHQNNVCSYWLLCVAVGCYTVARSLEKLMGDAVIEVYLVAAYFWNAFVNMIGPSWQHGCFCRARNVAELHMNMCNLEMMWQEYVAHLVEECIAVSQRGKAIRLLRCCSLNVVWYMHACVQRLKGQW